MRRDGVMVENISDLAGLSRTQPMMAFFLAMLLFSLAGIPPLAGFFAKFYVFLAAIKAGLYTLAVIGVLTQRGRRLLLSAHRQDHVFRRAGERLRADAGRSGVVLGVAGLIHHAVLRLSGAAAGCGDGGGEVAILTRDPETWEPVFGQDRARDDAPRSHGPAGVRHIAFDTLESTNTEALARCARRRARAVVDHRARARRRDVAGAAATGFRRRAICTPSLLLERAVAASPWRRNSRSWPPWRCMMRCATARPGPACSSSNGRTTCCWGRTSSPAF